ncbi:MAG: glutathione synthase/RimK-type ligase-like ATP-grasp enzyme [Phenylobacterium sp.]
MEANISSLVQACQLDDLPYRFIDTNKNCLLIKDSHFFQLNRTPFNTESMAALGRDKEHQYEMLKDQVNMPKTMGFLDYTVGEEYQQYLTHHSLVDIIATIESNFSYPLVIKKNRGALGIHVFLCHNRDEVTTAIHTVFDRNSPEYDYVVLAQQYIKTKLEMRVIFFDGKPVLSYERHFAKVEFGARYWETDEGKALTVDDNELINQAAERFKPAVTLPGLRFVGLDIIIDEQDNFYLIELNSGPKVKNYITSHGDKAVVEMYRKVLAKYFSPA